MDITKVMKGIVILGVGGEQIVSKIFDDDLSKKTLERDLFLKTKTHRIRDEILVVNGLLVVHRFLSELHLYVLGSKNENPICLDSVMNCLVETITSLLQKNIDKQAILDHMPQIILALDEICDAGVIMETDSNLVLARVLFKPDPLEQSMAQRLQSASEYVRFPWIRS